MARWVISKATRALDAKKEVDGLGDELKLTTKKCPNCRNMRLAEFTSLNKKYCQECVTWIPWHLEEGQKTLIQHQR